MAIPLEVTGDDIKTWSQRYEASAQLPALVRRLLFATTPLGTMIEMRADGGTRLGGWDGVVESQADMRFCPRGVSGWELSVQGSRSKFDEDFDKRSKEPPSPIKPAMTTYVAVTARRFGDKGEWAAEKKALGIWKDVRLLDADDLAAWLEQAPAVARWFAGLLRLPAYDVLDLEAFVTNWRERTRPPMPLELLLASRDRARAAEQVRSWAGSPQPGPLYVRGDTREEALLFVAVALSLAPEAEHWRGRTLVVESKEALRWAMRVPSPQRLILLPNFDDFDPKLLDHKTLAVVPLDAQSAPTRRALMLEALPFRRMAEVLIGAGFAREEAEKRAQESGGKIAALQRLYGYVTPPAWAAKLDAVSLSAMLLVGAWDPSNEADRSVIRELGADPEAVAVLCEQLRRVPDAATVRDEERWGSGTWTWAAPGDVWQQLASSIPAGMLTRFEKTALRVLSKPDPRFELVPDERFAAAIHDKVLSESEAIREGFATSLARLSLSDELLISLHGPGRGSGMAMMVVRELLAPEWLRWASVAPLLPLLAEAAPKTFLECLRKSLSKEEGAAHLLAEEAQLGSSPHTGLLWALETLGWSAELMPEVALALAELAKEDQKFERPGRLSNRPAESLHNLLHYALAQTLAPAEARLAALRRIIAAQPEVGFAMVLRLLESLHGLGFMSPARKPQILRWKVLSLGEQEERAEKELADYLKALVALASEQAGSDTIRWAELIKATYHCPDDFRAHILERLEAKRPQIDDREGVIWGALRHRLYLYMLADPSIWGREEHKLLNKLYSDFEPQDRSLRFSWLFQQEVELPSGFDPNDLDAKQRQVEAERDEALRTIWAHEDRWDALARLISRAEDKGILGVALGRAQFAEELEAKLLHEVLNEAYAPIVPTFAAVRFFGEKNRKLRWLESTLRELIAAGRGKDALGIALALPTEPWLWDILDSIGDPFRTSYWQDRKVVFCKDIPKSWERAVKSFARAGRLTDAARASAWGIPHVHSTTILEVLEALTTHPEEMRLFAREAARTYKLEQLFDVLDSDPSIDPSRLAKLELLLLPLMQDSKRQPKHLSAAMVSDVGQFVELIKWIYRREGDAPSESPVEQEEERQTRARVAFHILGSWKGYPGEGCAADEREEKLYEWSKQALQRTAKEERATAGAIEVTKILARAPAAEDGHWPCIAARRLIEEGQTTDLADYLQMAKRNRRGATRRRVGEGGKQEHEIAIRYRSYADALRAEWPLTAAMLDNLAQRYEHDAVREDERARTTLRRNGLEREDFAEAPQKIRRSTKGEHEAPVTRGIVRIDAISLQDFCCIKELRLEPRSATQDKGQWIVLLGENGTGKSTILRALALALGGPQVANAALATYPARLVRMEAERALCSVESGDQRYSLEILEASTGREARAEPNGTTARPFVFGYGTKRGSALGGPEPTRTETRFSNVATLFDESIHLFPALTWLKNRKLRAVQKEQGQQEIFEGVCALLCELLEVKAIEVFEDHVYAIAPKLGGRVPFEGLSDGYLTTTGWVVDLVESWLRWAERMKMPVTREFYKTMEGLVLVDELDLHLHPRWQRSIIQQLKGLFPRLSFVVTTHNPLTLLGTEQGEIQVLRWSEESGEIEALPLDLPPGLRADQVLTGDWFGLSSTVDQDTLQKIEAHQAMLLKGTPADDPERVALEAELRKRLGTFADTALDRMALEVAAELMQARLRERSPKEREALREKLKKRVQERLADKAREQDSSK